MLSNESPDDGNLRIKGGNSNVNTDQEATGRDLVQSVGCTFCHRGKVFSGGNFNTGVETLELPPHPDPTPTIDLGTGSGAFQTPQLFGLRKPAFFHTNAVVGLRNAVAFYDGPEFNSSPNGGRVRDLTETEIDDITAFLQAISRP